MPSHKPQYYGVVERALALLGEKTAALLLGVSESKTDRLWAKAMNYARDMSKRYVYPVRILAWASPVVRWPPTSRHGRLHKEAAPAHKITPRDAKCILLGTSSDHPRHTSHVRYRTTETIAQSQAITSNPAVE